MATVRHVDIDPIKREEIWQRQARISQISWGAVFAGTIAALALNWLLNFFGITLGFSIADATDGDALGDGLGIATVLWIFASMLASYFAGAWIAARLSGRPDDTVGMLHGMTVWGLGTIATLWLVSMGVSNLVYSGYQVLSGGVQAAAAVTSATAQGVGYAAQGTTDMASSAFSALPGMEQLQQSEIVTQLAANFKEQAVSIIADSENPQGADVSEQDVRTAIDKLDQTTMQDLVARLTDNDREGAKKILADRTDLSPAQIDSLLTGISQQVQQKLGTADNNQNLVADLQNIVKDYTVRKVSQIDAVDNSGISEQDVRQAINELGYQEMQTIGTHLLNGRPEAAKNVLISSTNLSRNEVDRVVDNVNAQVQPAIEEYKQTVEEIKQEANAAVEKASSYTQGVMWSIFAASALALAISLLGGKLGADEAQRNVVTAYSQYNPSTTTV